MAVLSHRCRASPVFSCYLYHRLGPDQHLWCAVRTTATEARSLDLYNVRCCRHYCTDNRSWSCRKCILEGQGSNHSKQHLACWISFSSLQLHDLLDCLWPYSLAWTSQFSQSTQLTLGRHTHRNDCSVLADLLSPRRDC